ncbi:hypothetical protein QOT17_008577 [Balamuthia mandrillaris]
MLEDIKTYNVLISSLLVQQVKNLEFWKGELPYYLTVHVPKFNTFPRQASPDSKDPTGGWTSQTCQPGQEPVDYRWNLCLDASHR